MTKLTLDDIRNYIIKIQVNYENAYRLDSTKEFKLLLASWWDILSNYPKEVCDSAVNNALAKARFAPRIGDIMEEIKIINSANKKTDEELWAELLSIKYETYDSYLYLRYPQHHDDAYSKIEKIYNNLDADIKLYLVNISALIEFSKQSDDSLQYEKSMFFKRMPILRKHAEDKIMSQSFLKLVNNQNLLLSSSDKK